MWADLRPDDLSLDLLKAYRSTVTAPDDFDEFWASTLDEARGHDLRLEVVPVETGLATVRLFDVSFAGFGGSRVRAWLRLPPGDNLPVVVEYAAYGSGRGHPLRDLLWSSAGFAHVVMDNRDQGAGIPSVMSRGLEDPRTYYYRELFTDAVRAVDAARQLPGIDPANLAVLGNSQGGGIALAVAGLVPDLRAVVARVPFLCDFPRAIAITDRRPYVEIADYLKTRRGAAGRALKTLRYFDGVNFARRASAPAWFSVGLMDPTCPPSTVFGAYHAYAGPKDLTVWPYNGHEGGEAEDDTIALDALGDIFGTVRSTS